MNSWSAQFEKMVSQKNNPLKYPYSDHARLEKIRKTDVKQILKKTAQDLQRLEFETNNCCSDGVKKPTKLKITTMDKVNSITAAKRQLKTSKTVVGSAIFSNPVKQEDNELGNECGALDKKRDGPEIEEPWTKINIIYGTSVHAFIDADHKIG